MVSKYGSTSARGMLSARSKTNSAAEEKRGAGCCDLSAVEENLNHDMGIYREIENYKFINEIIIPLMKKESSDHY